LLAWNRPKKKRPGSQKKQLISEREPVLTPTAVTTKLVAAVFWHPPNGIRPEVNFPCRKLDLLFLEVSHPIITLCPKYANCF
jgi:hypothetical protein